MPTIKIAVAALLIALAGCDNQKAEAAAGGTAPSAEPPAKEQPAPTEESNSPAEDPKMPADGMKHDPPIALDKVPDGHWYCDMGTAHYTQKTKGDGKCPLCSMDLKHMDHAKMGHDHKKSDGHEHGGDGHHHE